MGNRVALLTKRKTYWGSFRQHLINKNLLVNKDFGPVYTTHKDTEYSTKINHSCSCFIHLLIQDLSATAAKCHHLEVFRI